MDYDSDSEDLSDQEEYTETNVLLGYPSKQATEDTISHLGGHPTWLSSTTPPGTFAKCKVCQTPMSLLLQLNGDLPEHFPNDERRLYILSCRRKACTRKSGSIRALREVRRSKAIKGQKGAQSKEQGAGESLSQPPKQDLGAALFGASALSPQSSSNVNPFSMPQQGIPSGPVNPFAPLPPTSTLAAIPPQSTDSSQPSSSEPSNPFAPLPPTSTLAAISPQPQEDTHPSKTQPQLQETFASKLRVSDPSSKPSVSDVDTSEPWPESSAFPAPYPQLYLDADYESLSPTTQSTKTDPSTSKTQYTEDDAPASSSTTKASDDFESSLDTQFLRFSTRLSQNPEQVLRYEFKGVPLLYSSSDAVASCFPSLFHPKHSQSSKIITAPASSSTTSNNKIPRCQYCGSVRVFELQLVPGLISALEDAAGIEDIEEDGMEWGTIVLGVCEKDCCEVGQVQWREEWVGVQWEERVVRK